MHNLWTQHKIQDIIKNNRKQLTNVSILIPGSLSDTIQARLMSLMITMTKVKPSHIHTSINQFLESGNIPASRTHCTDDLRFPSRDIGDFFHTLESDVGAAKLGAGGGCLRLHVSLLRMVSRFETLQYVLWSTKSLWSGLALYLLLVVPETPNGAYLLSFLYYIISPTVIRTKKTWQHPPSDKIFICAPPIQQSLGRFTAPSISCLRESHPRLQRFYRKISDLSQR